MGDILPLFDPQAILATLKLHGVEVRVANLERVIASKRASDRPKDRDALPRLEALLRRGGKP